MTTAVYIFDDLHSFSDVDLEQALRMVSPTRREKALWYKHTLDRKLSVIAELLLMRVIGMRDPSYEYVGHDKPVLIGTGVPHFNLSHCSLGVACAISDAPVGIDIEPYDSYTAEVARVVFNPEEQMRVIDHPAQFAELWTVKESYLKYTGEGLTDELPTLLANTPGVGFATYHSPKGYACTLCSPHELNCLTPTFVDKYMLLNG